MCLNPPARFRIVVADDEPELLTYYQQIIPVLGHQVDGVARTGSELVRECHRTSPDLVITDLRMEDLSGDEAMELVSVPFVIVSAEDESPEYRERFRERLLAFLTKPINRFTLKDLFETLQLNCCATIRAPRSVESISRKLRH